MSKNGARGADYERNICNRLSLWVSGMSRQDVFWRSAMSGGRANLVSRKSKPGRFDAHAGDITATHKEGHHLLSLFFVDSKWYKNFELDAPVFGNAGCFVTCWTKASEEALQFSRQPLLICKEHRRGEFVATTERGYQILAKGDSSGVFKPSLTLHQEGALILSLRDMLMLDYQRIREGTDEGSGFKRPASHGEAAGRVPVGNLLVAGEVRTAPQGRRRLPPR